MVSLRSASLQGEPRQDFTQSIFVRGHQKEVLPGVGIEYWPVVLTFSGIKILYHAIHKRKYRCPRSRTRDTLWSKKVTQPIAYRLLPGEHTSKCSVVCGNRDEHERLCMICKMNTDNNAGSVA